MHSTVSNIFYQHKNGIDVLYHKLWATKGMRSRTINAYIEKKFCVSLKNISWEQLEEMKQWCISNDIKGGIYFRSVTGTSRTPFTNALCVLTNRAGFMAFKLRW